MKAFSQHPCLRLMVMALVAGAVVWGTSPSAGAQEAPSGSPDMVLVWQGEQYICSPVDPQSTEANQEAQGLPGESELAGPGRYYIRIYYSDPDRTHQVGYCISASPCTSPYCTGHKSLYVEVIVDFCDGL